MSQTANKALAEGKKRGQHKQREKKVWQHQNDRPMGPSNQKQDLKLIFIEFRDKIHQLCLAQEPNHRTTLDYSRGTEVKTTHQDLNSGSESRIEQHLRRNLKRYYLFYLGAKSRF